MPATDEIYSDLAKIGYALDMQQRWLAAVSRGDITAEAAIVEIAKDFRDAPAAFERAKSALFDALTSAAIDRTARPAA